MISSKEILILEEVKKKNSEEIEKVKSELSLLRDRINLMNNKQFDSVNLIWQKMHTARRINCSSFSQFNIIPI